MVYRTFCCNIARLFFEKQVKLHTTEIKIHGKKCVALKISQLEVRFLYMVKSIATNASSIL